MIQILKLINFVRTEIYIYLAGSYRQVKWRCVNIHNSTTISKSVINVKNITVGNYSYGKIHTESYENKSEGLIIGNYVSIANNVCFILGGNHQINSFTTFPIKAVFFEKYAEADAQTKGIIHVQDEVWLGYGVTVLSGVTIGKGSIVAAGSIITKDVAPFSIVGGNPAKFIKWRIPEELIPQRESINISDIKLDFIQKNMDLFYSPINLNILQLIKKKKLK